MTCYFDLIKLLTPESQRTDYLWAQLWTSRFGLEFPNSSESSKNR